MLLRFPEMIRGRPVLECRLFGWAQAKGATWGRGFPSTPPPGGVMRTVRATACGGGYRRPYPRTQLIDRVAMKLETGECRRSSTQVRLEDVMSRLETIRPSCRHPPCRDNSGDLASRPAGRGAGGARRAASRVGSRAAAAFVTVRSRLANLGERGHPLGVPRA